MKAAEAELKAAPPAGASPARPRARMWLRFLPVAVIAVVLAAVLLSGVTRHLSLVELKAHGSVLKAYVHHHPVKSVVIYTLAYAALISVSVPGALIMTLTGGLLFGVVVGGTAAIIGVSAGATVMYLAARSALGDCLRRFASPDGLIHKLECGVKRDAFGYLLSLRLLPAAPIWLVNICAGFVKMPLKTYVAATVLGVAPSTYIYSSIGSSLNRVFDRGGRPNLHQVFSLPVLAPLFALAVLAAVPLMVRAHRRRNAPDRERG